MTPGHGHAVLITGANAGIGKETARQLAERPDIDTIYLGCRNPARARAAQAELEASTKSTAFPIITIDVSDIESVHAAAQTIPEPVHAAVMNAGGNGGPTPRHSPATG